MQAPPAQFATKRGANTGSSKVRYFKKLLFRVGVGLDVGPVYENRLGGQISRFRHLFQYPRKDLVHGFCGKPMTEIITHRGKMRRFLLKRISQKPTAADICADLIHCSPQGRHAVQMLNQHHFEQHNRVHTGPPVIFAIQWFHHFIEPVKIYSFIYFSQQMPLGNQTLCIDNLYDTTIHFSAFQHLSSPRTILSYKRKKPSWAGVFRQAAAAQRVCSVPLYALYIV